MALSNGCRHNFFLWIICKLLPISILALANTVFIAPHVEAFIQNCNGPGCGEPNDSCYVPPASPVGTQGVTFDYQTITGTGHSHCCTDGVPSGDAECDDTGADLVCSFGSCIPIDDRCSTANFCSQLPAPVPTRASPNPICANNVAWSQVPIFVNTVTPTFTNVGGTARITATFSYIFDSMYDGINIATSCGGNIFNLEITNAGGTVLAQTDPAWEKGTWSPTFGTGISCQSLSGATYTFQARLGTSGGACSSSCLTTKYTFIVPTLDSNCQPGTPPPPPLDENCCGSSVCVGKPINVASGVLVYSETDANINGVGPSITLTRTYLSSRASIGGALGLGWSHPYMQNMTILTPGTPSTKQVLKRINGTGATELYTGTVNGTNPPNYAASQPADLTGTVTETTSIFTLTDLDGNVTQYDKTNGGRWMLTKDRFNNQVTGTYTGVNLTRIQDNESRGLTLTYSTGNRILTAKDDDLNTWRYAYDINSRLNKAFWPDNSTSTATRTYTYSGTPAKLSLIKDFSGNVIEGHEYYPDGKTKNSFAGGTTFSNATADKISLTYPSSPNGGTTTVTRTIDSSSGLTQTTLYDWVAQGGRGLVNEITGVCDICGAAENVQRTYNTLNLLTQEIDGNGNITNFTYNTDKLMATKTEAFGTALQRLTSYSYDTIWKAFVARIEQPSVVKPGQLKVTTRNFTGSTDRFTQLTETVSGFIEPADASPTTRTVITNFDTRHRNSSIDGPRIVTPNDTATYLYFSDTNPTLNLRGRLNTVTNALGHVLSHENYNAGGDARKITDANGVVSDFTYDGLRRMTSNILRGVAGCDTALDPLCATDLTTTTEFTKDGDLDHTILPRGNVIDFTYDTLHRRTGLERKAALVGNGDKQVRFYNTASLLSREELQQWNGTAYSVRAFTNYTYDNSARLFKTTHADGNFVQKLYDPAGNLLSVQDESHASANMTYDYDALERLQTVMQSLSTAPGGTITTTYGYNAHDDLATVSDANQNITTYTYNDFGEVRRMTSPVSTGTVVKSYDPAGNLITSIDARGITETRAFDSLNRLTSQTFSDGTPSITLEYDNVAASPFAKGQRTRALVGGSNPADQTFKYERRGMMLSKTQLVGGASTLSWSYDENGNLEQIKYPSLRVANYTFDFADRPLTVSSTDSSSVTLNYITNASYLPFGSEEIVTYPSLTETRAYNQRYLFTGQTVAAGATNRISRTYGYDPRGLRTSLTDSLAAANNRTMDYDDLMRLTKADGPYGINRFTYDSIGNRLQEQFGPSGSPTVTNYGYQLNAGKNTPLLIQTQTGGTTSPITSDQNGNITQDELNTYVYDGRNKISSETHNPPTPGTAINFLNDADGFRVREKKGINAWKFLRGPDDLRMVAITPTLTKDYIYLNDRIIAWHETASNSTVSLLFSDPISYPLMSTNASGTVLWKGEGKAFGEMWQSTLSGGTQPDNRFPGQWIQRNNPTSTDTQLFDNGMRVYSTQKGRYTQVDPLSWDPDEQNDEEMNPYLYVSDSPLDFQDPTGLYKLKGFPPELAKQMDDAIQAAISRLSDCPNCAGSDGPKIMKSLKNATYKYKPKNIDDCGETIKFLWFKHINVTGMAFNPGKCCTLASTLTHEASHHGVNSSDKDVPGSAWEIEKKCFNCGTGHPPPKAPKKPK